MRVCVGSLTPPWITYQSPYENNKECVCVGSLPPPWIPYSFFVKQIRNACLKKCVFRLGETSFLAEYFKERERESERAILQ